MRLKLNSELSGYFTQNPSDDEMMMVVSVKSVGEAETDELRDVVSPAAKLWRRQGLLYGKHPNPLNFAAERTKAPFYESMDWIYALFCQFFSRQMFTHFFNSPLEKSAT